MQFSPNFSDTDVFTLRHWLVALNIGEIPALFVLLLPLLRPTCALDMQKAFLTNMA